MVKPINLSQVRKGKARHAVNPIWDNPDCVTPEISAVDIRKKKDTLAALYNMEVC